MVQGSDPMTVESNLSAAGQEYLNLFQEIDATWVRPEIERRRTAGDLSEDFKVRQCLIRLPRNCPPIVAFNNEFGWLVKVKSAPNCELFQGRATYLHEIVSIEAVFPPAF